MKDFTMDELNDPKNRAQFILNMPPSMRGEVLYQFEFMARGSKGDLVGGQHLRDRFYKYFNDDWFKEVLTEVKRLREQDNK
jgi:hypothetical protein